MGEKPNAGKEEVCSFLTGCKLDFYAEAFNSNGYDDLKSLMEIAFNNNEAVDRTKEGGVIMVLK